MVLSRDSHPSFYLAVDQQWTTAGREGVRGRVCLLVYGKRGRDHSRETKRVGLTVPEREPMGGLGRPERMRRHPHNVWELE